MRWFHLRSRYGDITIKARFEWEAVQEAAERWRCSENEIVCVGWSPYRR